MDECYIASTALHEKQMDQSEENVRNWLLKDWVAVINNTVQQCNEFYRGPEGSSEVGEITPAEAKCLLMKNKGDPKKVIEGFLRERENKVSHNVYCCFYL